MQLRGVLLDLDDTLLDQRGAVRRALFDWLLGAAKPDPSAFSLACSRWGLPPSAVLSVGDRHDLDVLAARAAGLHAVHLDRHDEGPHDEASRVTSLAALPALIREQFPSARMP